MEKELCWTGKLDPDSFFRCIQDAIGISDNERDELHAAYMPIYLNKELWALLPKFKERYTLAILSNAPADKVAAIRATVDLSIFDHVFFSCEKGKSKMDPSFFLDIARALGEVPAACLYVDDQERHVQTARSLGFQTCLFKKTDDLILCLPTL